VHLAGDQDAVALAQRLGGVLGQLLPQRDVVEAGLAIDPLLALAGAVVDRDAPVATGLPLGVNRRSGLLVRLPMW
jgi:hypothetical protein